MLQSLIPNFDEEMKKLNELAPSGFILTFGFSLMGTEFIHYTYPAEWRQVYQARNYYAADPVFAWALSQTGCKRWSEIQLPDVRGVMREARRFGICHGAIFSHTVGVNKSFLSVSRPDRELTDAEVELVNSKFTTWVELVMDKPKLTSGELDVLRELRDGLGQREIADKLGIAESTVKQRAIKACSKLKAKNRTHAVAIAVIRNYLTA